MATIRYVLGFICFVIGFGHVKPTSHFLNHALNRPIQIPSIYGKMNPIRAIEFKTRKKLVAIAASQIGVRELTGNNDGHAVSSYLKLVGLPPGYAWCAAFISWVFAQEGYSHPRTAWSPALFPRDRITATPAPADLIGIHVPSFNRIAHVGMVERSYHDWIISIEGNTNMSGGRDGDGVYRRWRHRRTIARFANWLTGNRKEKFISDTSRR